MLPITNDAVWITEEEHHHHHQQTITSFKPMLEAENDWFNISNPNPSQTTTNDNNNLILLNHIDSSVSSSPSPSLFHHPLPDSLDSGFGSACFFTESHHLGSFLNRGTDSIVGFTDFSSQNEMGSVNFATNFMALSMNGDQDYVNATFMDRGSKLLEPLDDSAPPVGSQPTLFQKRVALRSNKMKTKMMNSSCEKDKDLLGSISIDGGSSSFNYDSDEFTDMNISKLDQGGKKTNSNPNGGFSTGAGGSANGGGDCKGKKKGLPAKNLMAERRRRKKLNDRLYMLRSVVPKISTMDRASILGDAIDYLKELLQRINDLHNELESTPSSSTLTQTTSFHPLTPTLPNLPSLIKEELCPSSLPSPNGQPARIEVRLREGRAVNIHMFCGRRPGLLLSTVMALDGLGLDIQQAVISCFNGFAMDIFRAEQCKNGQDVHPDQIKALLMDVATFHGSPIVGNCEM